jgi:hypothetical protein
MLFIFNGVRLMVSKFYPHQEGNHKDQPWKVYAVKLAATVSKSNGPMIVCNVVFLLIVIYAVYMALFFSYKDVISQIIVGNTPMITL